MQFFRKKYCRLQLGCQTNATCFASCNEIIFYARRVFKNVSGILIMSCCHWFLLKQIARKVAVGVSHAATFRVELRKVEAASTFFGCHTRKSSLQLAMQRHCVTSCKENCLVWHGLKIYFIPSDILVKHLWKAIGVIPFKHLNTSRTQVLFLVSFTLGNFTEVFRPLAIFSTQFWMSSNFCLFDVGKLINHCYNTALITRVRSSFSGCSVVYYLLQYIPVHSLPGDELK